MQSRSRLAVFIVPGEQAVPQLVIDAPNRGIRLELQVTQVVRTELRYGRCFEV